MDRVIRRQTTWNLVNIKARSNQTPSHYVDVFRQLYANNLLVDFPKSGRSGSIKSMVCSQLIDENGVPNWIEINLLSYMIVDPTAFYNVRAQEDVNMEDWNEDIVSNKKEMALYFIPSVHTLIVKCNGKISLNNVVFYFFKALNRLEPDGFDVDVIVDRDILDRILNAHLITRIEANISYSNPGHTGNFEAAFDNKLRGMGGNKTKIIAEGTQENPLNSEEDGILSAIVNLAERNGNVKATIKRTENSKSEIIDSSEHPRKLVVREIVNDICSTLYNSVREVVR